MLASVHGQLFGALQLEALGPLVVPIEVLPLGRADISWEHQRTLSKKCTKRVLISVIVVTGAILVRQSHVQWILLQRQDAGQRRPKGKDGQSFSGLPST